MFSFLVEILKFLLLCRSVGSFVVFFSNFDNFFCRFFLFFLLDFFFVVSFIFSFLIFMFLKGWKFFFLVGLERIRFFFGI